MDSWNGTGSVTTRAEALEIPGESMKGPGLDLPREVGMGLQSLQVKSGGGILPFPPSRAASTWRSSRNPMILPAPSPNAVGVYPIKG